METLQQPNRFDGMTTAEIGARLARGIYQRKTPKDHEIEDFLRDEGIDEALIPQIIKSYHFIRDFDNRIAEAESKALVDRVWAPKKYD